MTPPSLLEQANHARLRAHAPYSHFTVGAALQATDGRVFTGCNVENASYGLTLCAERVAIFKAISEGCRSFARIVVLTDTEHPTPPCGACRQVLWELAGDLEVILANTVEEKVRFRMKDLLPHAFTAHSLPEKPG